MDVRVNSIEAAASLDQLIDRVVAGDGSVVIERDGMPLVRLVSASASLTPPVSPPLSQTGTAKDLVEFLRNWTPVDDGWAEGVEEAVRLGNQPISLEDPWER